MKSELSSKRSLRFESLETRTLLAADLLVPHNFAMPEDCDDSGSVSPLDALVIINQLNSPESAGVLDSTNMLDVDADGSLSPLDALVVINYLNRSSTDGSAACRRPERTARRPSFLDLVCKFRRSRNSESPARGPSRRRLQLCAAG